MEAQEHREARMSTGGGTSVVVLIRAHVQWDIQQGLWQNAARSCKRLGNWSAALLDVQSCIGMAFCAPGLGPIAPIHWTASQPGPLTCALGAAHAAGRSSVELGLHNQVNGRELASLEVGAHRRAVDDKGVMWGGACAAHVVGWAIFAGSPQHVVVSP
jgi:hypothetical protein